MLRPLHLRPIPVCRFPAGHHHLLHACLLAAVAASLPAQQQYRVQRFDPFAGAFSYTNSVVLGDVDRDGDLDAVALKAFCDQGGWCGDDQDRLFLNDGNGGFVDGTAAGLPVDHDGSRGVALGDIDGDGDLDLVVGKHHYARQAQNRLYLNDGRGAFSDATTSHLPRILDETADLALADVDGDGDLDLLVANGSAYFGDQNRLLLNDGSGHFRDVTTSRMPTDVDASNCVAVADVDGDGDVDVLFGNIAQNRLYLNSGSGVFVDATNSHLPAWRDVTRDLAFGDLDGDGALDLVVGNGDWQDEPDRVYRNDGRGRFSDVTLTALPRGPAHRTQGVGLGDVDGDGDLDLAFCGSHNGLYRNDGAGVFTAAFPFLPSLAPYTTGALAFGDVDDDGDADLFGGDWLCVNLQRHLETPFEVRVGGNYRLDVYARGVAGRPVTAYPWVSLAARNAPVPGLGTLRIDPVFAVALPAVTIPQPSGFASGVVHLPPDSSLAGLSLHAQAVWLQGREVRLTNATVDLVLR